MSPCIFSILGRTACLRCEKNAQVRIAPPAPVLSNWCAAHSFRRRSELFVMDVEKGIIRSVHVDGGDLDFRGRINLIKRETNLVNHQSLTIRLVYRLHRLHP